MSKRKLCILLKSLPTGGVEKMMLNLASGLSDRGYQVDIVLFAKTANLVHSVPNSVTLLELVPGNTKGVVKNLFTVARAFQQYTKESRPDVVISAKEQANLVNVLFKLVCRKSYCSVITRHVPLDSGLVGTDAKPIVRFLYRKVLWRADQLVAVSEGIAEEIRAIIPRNAEGKVSVISNPVIDDFLFEKASEPIDEQWFKDRKVPVIVSSGRLSFQKGFDVLLEAVSLLRKKNPVRLIILGEGEMRDKLTDEIVSHSLEKDVKLLGHKSNPYPYYKNADLFVLSSRWEGQPLALIEVLSLGTRVVSTDCRTGPDEILQGGKLGILVRPENPTSLAAGIEEALADPDSINSVAGDDIGKYSVSGASAEYDELFCRLLKMAN